jgi:CheY-like chemotaxis protein
VEDEPLIRLLVIDILSEAGFEVLEAQDPAEALTVLKSDEQIDVLLTDVRMRGCMDGFELAEVAKRRRPELRVIVTSGYLPAAMSRPAQISFTSPFRHPIS